MLLEKTGIPSEDLIKAVTPSESRRKKGPIAIIECFQSIPCNPCYTSCKRGAIKELKNINDIPEIYEDKCNGCGLCVSKCPGLAIFVIDESYSETEAIVRIPYEFLPLPEEGSYVTGTDRDCHAVCRAKVIKVQVHKSQDRTAIVWLEVPKHLSMRVRGFKISDFFSDNTFVCRCEEVTLGELREFIRKGYRTIDELKRISRVCMGSCQGRNCLQIIIGELARMTETNPAELPMPAFRPPVKPIKLEFLCQEEFDEK